MSAWLAGVEWWGGDGQVCVCVIYTYVVFIFSLNGATMNEFNAFWNLEPGSLNRWQLGFSVLQDPINYHNIATDATFLIN